MNTYKNCTYSCMFGVDGYSQFFHTKLWFVIFYCTPIKAAIWCQFTCPNTWNMVSDFWLLFLAILLSIMDIKSARSNYHYKFWSDKSSLCHLAFNNSEGQISDHGSMLSSCAVCLFECVIHKQSYKKHITWTLLYWMKYVHLIAHNHTLSPSSYLEITGQDSHGTWLYIFRLSPKKTAMK